MTALPTDRSAFAKLWPNFSAWLASNGSSIMPGTNPYELARFLTDTGTGVVYMNGAGRITSWTGGADHAFTAWKTSASWRATPRVKRNTNARKRLAAFTALVQRDGCGCIYCDEKLTLETMTIEHIVPLTAGGPNTLINKALACEPCNKAAGHLSPVEKMRKVAR